MRQDVFYNINARLERTHWWFVGRRRILLNVAHAVTPPNSTIIDIGCGTGGNIAAFDDSHRRIGVDPTPEAIDIARRCYPSVEFRVGHAPDAIRDVLDGAGLVLLNDVLEHVEDDYGLLRAIASELSPGAHVLLTVPAEPRLWSPHDVAHGHYRRYTRNTLSALWTDLPLEPLLLGPINRRLYYPVRFIRWMTARLGRAAGESGTDVAMPPVPINWGLTALFSAESARLGRALAEGRTDVSGRGVSLLAVLRRTNE